MYDTSKIYFDLLILGYDLSFFNISFYHQSREC